MLADKLHRMVVVENHPFAAISRLPVLPDHFASDVLRGRCAFQLTGVDKLSAINSLNGVNAVKIGGSAAATVTLSLGNPVGYSGTSTANFQMGNDENTLKVADRAKELGLEPQAYCDDMARQFRECTTT